jgi:hypothetical protein
MTRHEIWIGSGFVERLQLVTTNNYNTIANPHALPFTAAYFKASVSLIVVSWLQCSLGVARLRLLTVEIPQLPCSGPNQLATVSHLTSSCNWLIQAKVKVKLRPTVIWPVSLGVKPHMGPKTRCLLLSDSLVFVDVVLPLLQEDGSIIYRGQNM